MNLYELCVKIGADVTDVNKGIDETGKKTSDLGEKIKNGLATVGKAAVVGVTAAATAIGTIGTKAIQAYADYEQLVGGVETLFKDSQDKVMEYANNAYKTAGLSANEYMETVTSFSASLLQSLDGDTSAAAEKANLALTDMSDNANKMGTDMTSIQNAYQGFAKANYTMLDNLKLGYGGTQAEMQRLLEDAEKISGIKYDISSYADIVDAIHVVQTEMDRVHDSRLVRHGKSCMAEPCDRPCRPGSGLGNPRGQLHRFHCRRGKQPDSAHSGITAAYRGGCNVSCWNGQRAAARTA